METFSGLVVLFGITLLNFRRTLCRIFRKKKTYLEKKEGNSTSDPDSEEVCLEGIKEGSQVLNTAMCPQQLVQATTLRLEPSSSCSSQHNHLFCSRYMAGLVDW